MVLSRLSLCIHLTSLSLPVCVCEKGVQVLVSPPPLICTIGNLFVSTLELRSRRCKERREKWRPRPMLYTEIFLYSLFFFSLLRGIIITPVRLFIFHFTPWCLLLLLLLLFQYVQHRGGKWPLLCDSIFRSCSPLFSSLCTAAAAFISPHVSPFFFLVWTWKIKKR